MTPCNHLIIQASMSPKVGDFKGVCDEPCDDDPNLKDLGSQVVDEIRRMNGGGPDFDYLNR